MSTMTAMTWPNIANVPGLRERVSEHQLAALATATSRRFGLLTGTPGTGKAQPLDATIMTKRGPVTMGAITVGDRVLTPSGKESTVISVFDQGVKNIYRVTFSDGASTECCDEHLWLTQTRCSRKNAQRNGWPLFRAAKVRSLAEIRRTLLSSEGHKNHYIPMTLPFEMDQEELPLDAYLLGLLLGNGCFRNLVGISSIDDEVVRYVENSLPPGHKLAQHNQCDYLIRGNGGKGDNLVLNAIRDLGLLGKLSTEKFIPKVYKYGSIETRIAVLQGLLDTDGSTDGHFIEFSSSSEHLASDVRFLVESIGGTAVTNWRLPEFHYRGEARVGKESARVSVKLPPDTPPFRLPRKLNKYKPPSRYLPARSIASVECVGQKEARCIALDSADGLYLTDHCIVTHNTHSTGVLVSEVMRTYGSRSLAVCAPTGKAAVRLTAAMQRQGAAVTATTIHQLLEISRNGHDGDGWGFRRNAGNPLEEQFIVCDEMSMCDTDLAADLLRACPHGSHVLWIGDPYQLPPVGHGAPLRDLIASGVVPNGHLTEIRRNAGMIVQACACIKDGRSFEVVTDRAAVDPAAGRNLWHVEAREPAAQVRELLGIYEGIRRAGKRDLLWDIQVLSATNKGADLGRRRLNELLQTQLNADGASAPGNPFRVGDKLICLRNHWCLAGDPQNPLDADRDCEDGHYLANGEIGQVVAVTAKWTAAAFTSPKRLVRIAMQKAAGGGDEDEGGNGGSDEGGGNGCKFFDLAYAITGHKSQGSEWPIVIVLIDESAGARMVCSREWLYTVLSRAGTLCITIGRRAVMEQMARRPSLERRKTFLKELVQQGGAA